MTIKYSPLLFVKLKKVDVRILKSFKEKILIFSKNPYNSMINNHALHDPYKGLRSIDITADYRVIYKEKQEGKDNVVYFLKLGTHKELYG